MDEFEALALAAAAKNKRSSPQKSFGQTLKENLLGDDDPNTQNFGEKVGSALNKAGESLTFGLVGDEASAAVESVLGIGQPTTEDLVRGDNRSAYERRLDHYRQQEDVLERDNPGVALGADVGGAVAGMALPLGMIGTLKRGAGLFPRVAASSGAGATGGAVYGYAEGEGQQDRLAQAQSGATLGGIVGGAIPAVGAGVQKIADAIVGNRAVKQLANNAPTTAERLSEGRALYNQIDDAGVQVTPEAFDSARSKIVDTLQSGTAYTPRPGGRTITPNTSAVVDNMADMADEMAGHSSAALPIKEIDSLRRQAGAAAGNVANKSDQQAGMAVIEGLDDFIKGLGPDDVVTGDVNALKTLLPKAREVWAKMSKSQLLDDAIEQQDNYLSGGASAIRNRFASILRNPKLSRGFSEAEKKVMQRVVSGSIPQQLVNYMGSGLGMMGQMGAGAALGGPIGFLGGTALAVGSRKASEAMTRRNAEIARALVANGGMETLPVATDSARKIAESLARRGAAVIPQ